MKTINKVSEYEKGIFENKRKENKRTCSRKKIIETDSQEASRRKVERKEFER